METKVITTTREILASFAYCIIKSSPYPSVTNLSEILEAIRKFIISKGYKDELECDDKFNGALYFERTYKELHELFKEIRDNVPEFNKLNITKRELDKGFADPNYDNRPVKFGITGRGVVNPRDTDFIDLDACIRNVLNMIE